MVRKRRSIKNIRDFRARLAGCGASDLPGAEELVALLDRQMAKAA